MKVKGIQGSISLDGDHVTVSKGGVFGVGAAKRRIHLRDITGLTYKPGTWLFHGYIQILVAGSIAMPEQRGILEGGRPPSGDMNSISIWRFANTRAQALVDAIEDGRARLSR